MTQINAYLHFGGNCAEAMRFYKDCIGGELKMQTVGETPMAAQMPKETHGNVLHSTLEKDGFTIMASDMMEPGGVVTGNRMTLCVVCSSKEEIETFYSKLSAGGKVGHPLKEEFFGTFGDLTDKYGIDWMFQFSVTPPSM